MKRTDIPENVKAAFNNWITLSVTLPRGWAERTRGENTSLGMRWAKFQMLTELACLDLSTTAATLSNEYITKGCKL